MFLPLVAVGFMFGTVMIKWLSTASLQSKKSKLSEASEKNGQARQRLKVAVGEVSISEREIEKLNRKIKTSEHKIPKLEEEVQAHFQENAEHFFSIEASQKNGDKRITFWNAEWTC